MVSENAKRCEWDARLTGAKVVPSSNPGEEVVYYCTAKPPIPFMVSREIILGIYNFPAGTNGLADGVHLQAGQSVSLPDYAMPSGCGAMVRANLKIIGARVQKNPDGPGSKYEHFRILDMGGGFPGFLANKISRTLAIKDTPAWANFI